MFINFSNHPSNQWSSAQINAASDYGEIIDIPFPEVPADAGSDEIMMLAKKYSTRILKMNPSAVMCQGEFALAFAVVSQLKSRGVTVLAACSERKTIETTQNGATHKTACYEFKRFREYVS